MQDEHAPEHEPEQEFIYKNFWYLIVRYRLSPISKQT